MHTSTQPPAVAPGPAPRAGRAPGPGILDLIRRWPQSRRDRRAFFGKDVARFGDVVRYDAGNGSVVHLLAHPEHARHVLVENARRYGRSPVYDIFRLHMGESLFSVEGDEWARMRLDLRALFARERLEKLPGWAVQETRARIEAWRRRGLEHPVEIGPELRKITLGMILRMLFDEVGCDVAARIFVQMEIIQQEVHGWFDALVRWPRWMPTPGNQRFHRARAALRRIVVELLGSAAPVPGLRGDRAVDHVFTFLHSGQATAAHWMTHVTRWLARFPELQDELASRRAPEKADAVLLESLRLAPPAWLIDRHCLEDDRIGPHVIPAGSTVILAPYFIHRHRDFWSDADQFRPERFMGPDPEPRHDQAFLPFGAGPRRCIGHRMAMMQARPILETLLQELAWDAVPGPEGDPHFSVTLSPPAGVMLAFRDRRELQSSHSEHPGGGSIMSIEPRSLRQRLEEIAERKRDAQLTTYGKFSDADLESLQKALATDPDNQQIREMAAFSFYGSDRLHEAIAIYEDLTRTHPNVYNYYYYLGNAYAKLGEHDKAIQNWEIVVGGNDAPIAKKSKARIEEMRKSLKK